LSAGTQLLQRLCVSWLHISSLYCQLVLSYCNAFVSAGCILVHSCQLVLSYCNASVSAGCILVHSVVSWYSVTVTPP